MIVCIFFFFGLSAWWYCIEYIWVPRGGDGSGGIMVEIN